MSCRVQPRSDPAAHRENRQFFKKNYADVYFQGGLPAGDGVVLRGSLPAGHGCDVPGPGARRGGAGRRCHRQLQVHNSSAILAIIGKHV